MGGQVNEVAKTEEANACRAESPQEPPAEAQCWALADGYPHVKVPSMGLKIFANLNLLTYALEPSFHLPILSLFLLHVLHACPFPFLGLGLQFLAWKNQSYGM